VVYTILEGGGFSTGGMMFDAKIRRPSIDPEDLFHAHIGGLDTLARALLAAEKMVNDGSLQLPLASATPVGSAISARRSSLANSAWPTSPSRCSTPTSNHAPRVDGKSSWRTSPTATSDGASEDWLRSSNADPRAASHSGATRRKSRGCRVPFSIIGMIGMSRSWRHCTASSASQRHDPFDRGSVISTRKVSA
jgi:hypothetical protein